MTIEKPKDGEYWIIKDLGTGVLEVGQYCQREKRWYLCGTDVNFHEIEYQSVKIVLERQ